MEKIGITTQVPIEILIAAGYWPVDLGNVFLADDDPGRFVQRAEEDGFPIRSCARTKGIYGACLELGLKTVVGTEGDCAASAMLYPMLQSRGVRILSFSYPDQSNPLAVQKKLEDLAEKLETTLHRAESIREELSEARGLALQIDDLTWAEGLVNGWENHSSLLNTSDFNGSHIRYCDEARQLLQTASQRRPYNSDCVRLAYVGAPSMYAWDLYHFLESEGAHVVFNETQRQRAMPIPGESLAEQYANLTRPYLVSHRLRDIVVELKARRVDGIVHYNQAFCGKEIPAMLMRRTAGLPAITLDGNDEYTLGKRIKARLRNFLEVVRRLRDSERKISDFLRSERRVER